jgi:hypothetical protein
MRERFIIALSADARRSTPRIDLIAALTSAAFKDLYVLERATGGKSLTVEMPGSLASEVRRRLPFAIVEPDVSLDLL